MRTLILGTAAAVALLLAAPATPAATVTVSIVKTGFVPPGVSIDVGDTVTWKNTDTITHQVVANTGAFASPILGAGKSYSFTFKRAGTFRYHDALHVSLKGTVTVKGPPPSVTLAASAPLVKFGSPVTLTGAVSSKKTGETVTLLALPVGQTNKQVIATLQTAAGGAFSFAVTPQIYTTYQAQWKGTETSVIVQVSPVIKLPAAVRGFFHATVTPPAFAGHTVFLQRWSPLQGRWLSFRRLVLGPRSGRIFPITYAPRHARTSLRILLPQDQAGNGYLETWSGTQPVKRR
jgi:plastocyanin